MADTLGSLLDKLTVVKLKQWHTDDQSVLKSLSDQESQLKTEIDQFFSLAINGNISLEKLCFPSNKVYKDNLTYNFESLSVEDVQISTLVSKLAEINCELWHCQEKVYDFEQVPVERKNHVIKDLARLNLERNRCIDEIDKYFHARISMLP
jgi:hypothetical protein